MNGGSIMSDYTINQHYISRYILKRFLNQCNQIDVVLIQDDKFKRFSTNKNNICVERDFYEDWDQEGQYIERNRTENKFAALEDSVANQIDPFIDLIEQPSNKQLIMDKASTSQWESISVWLMLHLTLVMVRSPKLKGIAFGNSELPKEINQIFYKELVWGKKEAIFLAKNSFQGSDLGTIFQVIQRGEQEGGSIEILMNNLVSNYYVELYFTPENQSYYFTDNPVIVNEILDIDYFMPLSPKVAIALKRNPETEKFMARPYCVITKETVAALNRRLIQQADKVIIVQNMKDSDVEFIKEIRKR